jgi:putative Mn2+ efflux pump MntP
MGFLEILMIAVGLAMDAFAVSLGAGASGRALGGRAVFRLSFHFGLFQLMMPVVGRRPQRRPPGFHPADPRH